MGAAVHHTRVLLGALCAVRRALRVRTVSAPHADDLALVTKALAGAMVPRQTLAARLECVGRMVAFRNRRLGSPLEEEELRDVTQDVITKVLAKLADYRGLAAFESWVFVFCEGELRNAARKKRRRLARLQDLRDAAPAVAPTAPEPAEDLHECLQVLREEDRAWVWWKHFEGLTLDEISQRAAQNLNTVKSRYTRALLQLRRCLERRGSTA